MKTRIQQAQGALDELLLQIHSEEYSRGYNDGCHDAISSHASLLASLRTAVNYLKMFKLDKKEIELFEKDIKQAEVTL